jgi:hypothetical protein
MTDDESDDESLGAEIMVFGATPHRTAKVRARCVRLAGMARIAAENGDTDLAEELRDRAQDLMGSVERAVALGDASRRVQRLEDRLARVEERAEQAEANGKEALASRLKKRAIRIRTTLQRLSDRGGEVSPDNLLDDDASLEDLAARPAKSFDSVDGFVNSFFGFDTGASFGATQPCEPMVGFFARRAERYGADPAVHFGDGFVQSVGNWLANLFSSRAKKTLGIAPGVYRIPGDTTWVYEVLRSGSVRAFRASGGDYLPGTPAGIYPAGSQVAVKVAQQGVRQGPLTAGRRPRQARRVA